MPVYIESEKGGFLMIYCVEDESTIRDLMVYTLKASGFDARGFESASDFWPAMKEQEPALIILDVMLPDEDGLTILKALRSSPVTVDIPVIMATAKGMMEMVSRIKAVLRRATPKQAEVLACGGISMDKSRHTVTVYGAPVSLTLKEYELLKLFMENPDRVFTREVLLSEIWGNAFIGETRTVDVHIGTLRTKLAQAGNLIETVRGVGYRMGLKK